MPVLVLVLGGARELEVWSKPLRRGALPMDRRNIPV
jgi:hypothetical protein